MEWQAHQKISPVVIGFKYGPRRTIGLQSLQHFWNSRAATFGETEFFQEFADAAIAIPAGGKTSGLKFLDADGTVQSGITGHGDFIRQNPDFNRLPDFVAAVINRID